MDKAGKNYWKDFWKNKKINKIDINYYTYKLLHKLFLSYFEYDSSKSFCEIGCAFSSYLLYFNDFFGYQINGFDYEKDAVKITKLLYKKMGYNANIFYRDFFCKKNFPKYDILMSWGVFEHFKDLEKSILHTRNYLKERGKIITVIPNFRGLVGFLQKKLNKKIYDIHIPYTKNDILNAHEKTGYKTLFCNYFGIWQMGVLNLEGIINENFWKKILNIPGKPLYHLSKIVKIDFSNKFFSPYVIYIGEL